MWATFVIIMITAMIVKATGIHVTTNNTIILILAVCGKGMMEGVKVTAKDVYGEEGKDTILLEVEGEGFISV